MTSCRDARGQRRTPRPRPCRFDLLKLAIKRTFLPPHTPHFSAVPGGVPTDAHSRHTTFAGPEQGDLSAERVLITVVRRLQVGDTTGNSHAGNLGKAAAGDPNVIGV